MDRCDNNDGNPSNSDTAQGSVSDMLDGSDQTQAAAGMENGNSEKTGDHNQTLSIDSADRDSHGACAAGGQEGTLRSHYHDEENRKLSSGTSAVVFSSDSSARGLDRAQCGSNAGNIPWLQQVTCTTIPDTEVTVGRPLAGAVSEETSNDSVPLGQHVVERVRPILSENEEHEQFTRQIQRLEQVISEQRDLDRRLREVQERQPCQQEADAVCSQQLQFNRREPSQNCEICGMNVDQQDQEYHLCQPTDNCMCSVCIIERRGREGEIQEPVERQPQGQEAVSVNSQQQQFSRMGLQATQNCENCNMCIDQQLQEYHHHCHDCCICLELLDPRRDCYTFPNCLHTIHRECWDGMLRHGLYICPLCRRPAF